MNIRQEKLKFLNILLNVLVSPNSFCYCYTKTKFIPPANFSRFIKSPHHPDVLFQADQRRNKQFLFLLVVDPWWSFILFLFLLLLIFWFYRRYEIDKIKHQSHFQNRVHHENVISGNLHQQETEIKIDQCLTGLCEKRICFFYNNENMIRIDDGVNESHEPATVDLLLRKIDGDTFCNRCCRVKENNGSSSEFHAGKIQIKPFYHSTDLHHSVNSSSSFIHNLVFQTNGTPLSPFDEEFILKAVKTIELNYSDYRFSAEHLAKELNMSVSQVNRKLNSLTGEAAGRLISSCRLQRASVFLIQNSDSISDICFSTGYNGTAYFSRAFKKEFGCTPSVYRKLMTQKSISVRK